MGVRMNKLKELRSRFGLKQKDIAEKLHTTQQTVARWESGGTAIPVAHLKDLASFFGCTVDELLGMEISPRLRQAAAFPLGRKSISWGTLTVRMGASVRNYAIDEANHERLVELLDDAGPTDGTPGWINFDALNNLRVLLNPAHISALRFFSDDVEAMPSFWSQEAYQSLTSRTPPEDLGPVVLNEREEVVRSLSDKDAETDLTREDYDNAETEMHTVRVMFGDGRSDEFSLSDDAATSYSALEAYLDSIAPNAFVLVHEEGREVREYGRAGSVAAIEIPLQAYLGYLAQDEDRERESIEK